MDCFRSAVAESDSCKDKTLLEKWRHLEKELEKVIEGTNDYWELVRMGKERLEVLKEREGIEIAKEQQVRKRR